MPQPEAPRALSLRVTQVAQRWKFELRRRTPLEQVEQGRDRGGREPEQRQRVEETHVSRRNARPNGKSVCTWGYAMPWRRQAVRQAASSRWTVSAYARASPRGRTPTVAGGSG